MVPLKWHKQDGFTKYIDCYNKVLKNKIDGKTKKSSIIYEFFKEGALNFLTEVEKDFDCAGMCEIPLFYVTRDISDGPPTQECLIASLYSMQNNLLGLGKITLATGVILLIGFVSVFP